MKWISLLGVCIAIVTSSQAQSTVSFNDALSWDQLKAKSRSEKKIIFIDVYATWCIPCKKMDTEVYTNKNVSQYLTDNFISVKLQADSSKNDGDDVRRRYEIAQKILNKFKIRSYPSYLFIDANENIQHRGVGYMTPDSFIAFCRSAQDTNRNYAAQLRRYKSDEMGSDELLTYAITLHLNREDSLSKTVARSFKEKTIINNPLEEFLIPKYKSFFYTFGSLINRKDSFPLYVYLHKQEIDARMKDTGFSDRLITQIAIQEFITPSINKADSENRTPDWNTIREELTRAWDKNLASDLVLRHQISWYGAHKDWKNQIKYHMERLDKLNNKFGVWEAIEANDFIYLTVLKHCNDSNILKKAKDYMQSILKSYPDDHEKMDTYANVLYKLGRKNEAIEIERRALSIAETKKDKENTTLFKETISKMEANAPTCWD